VTAQPRRRQLSWAELQLERFAKSRPGGWLYVNVFNHIDTALLRLSNGRFSLSVGSPVLLLTTTGAKSDQRRSTPLLYATDGDRIVLVASKAGAAKHPAWYHNLKANPKVDVLASGRSGAYVATEAQGEERTRLWEEVNDLYAGYETYQQRAGARTIPVIVLTRPS